MSKEKIFKIGDVVRLKSGGKDMTVVKYTHSNNVQCEWYDKDKDEYKNKEFLEETLLKSEELTIKFQNQFKKQLDKTKRFPR